MNWTEPVSFPPGFPAYPRWYWLLSLTLAGLALLWVGVLSLRDKP